jgi:hypothetical protein
VMPSHSAASLCGQMIGCMEPLARVREEEGP